MRAAMLMLGFWLASPLLASAAPITWEFEGRVALIPRASSETLAELSSLGVAVGSPFAGQAVFDPDAGAILSVHVAIGSYEAGFVSGGASSYTVVNGTYLGMFGWGPGSSSVFDAPAVGFELIALEPYGSETLPLAPPDLASLRLFDPTFSDPDNGYATYFFVYGTEADIIGEFTSLALVPEPGAAALVGLTLAAAAALRRQRAVPASRPRPGRAAAGARRGS